MEKKIEKNVEIEFIFNEIFFLSFLSSLKKFMEFGKAKDYFVNKLKKKLYKKTEKK